MSEVKHMALRLRELRRAAVVALRAAIIVIGLTATNALADALDDACIVDALNRIPRVEGLRVVSSSAASRVGVVSDVTHVTIVVEFNKRKIGYRFPCQIGGNNSVRILGREVFDPSKPQIK